jgi:probable rRNA maturation factor
MIQYFTEKSELPVFPKRAVSSWIKEVAAMRGCKAGDISYIFCNNDKILEINRKYLQHDYFTDIITFDDSDQKQINGDIFISVETVAENAAEYKLTFEQELYRVMIHGILHLCGQDDHSDKERAEMTRLENEAIDRISWKRF